jgi:hypothetical protein
MKSQISNKTTTKLAKMGQGTKRRKPIISGNT